MLKATTSTEQTPKPKCNSLKDLVADGLSLLEKFAFFYMQAPRNKPNAHIMNVQVFQYRFIKQSCEIEKNPYTNIYIYYSINLDGILE